MIAFKCILHALKCRPFSFQHQWYCFSDFRIDVVWCSNCKKKWIRNIKRHPTGTLLDTPSKNTRCTGTPAGEVSYYTFDELRAFGCPDELLIQYVCCTKDEIDRLMEDEVET